MSLVLFVYFAVLLLLCSYGVHRAHLAFLWLRYHKRVDAVAAAGEVDFSLLALFLQADWVVKLVMIGLLAALAKLHHSNGGSK